jgi:hypothetical protein
MTIRVTPRLAIDEDELEISYILASGPGGQNVKMFCPILPSALLLLPASVSSA